MTNHIGLDGHSKTCTFVVMNDKGEILGRSRVLTSESTLLYYVKSVKRPRRLAFEETNLAQWFYLTFKDHVDEQIVCNPLYLGKVPGAKGDFRDALRLSDDLRCNRLIPVHHEDSKLWELRTIISGYQDVTTDVTRTKNRYKALFRSQNLKTAGQKLYGDKTRIEELSSETDRFVADNIYEQLQQILEVKVRYKAELKLQSKKHSAIRLLCTAPGIDIIRASIIAALVCTPHRFANKHKFWSYCMLVKYIDESDDVIYGKRGTPGRRDLKAVFTGAGLSVLQGDNSFRKEYDRLRSKGVGHKDAKKAIDRKVAATCLAILKRGVKYDDKFQEKQGRLTKHRV